MTTKQTLVPDSKGVIRVSGFEGQVTEFKTSHKYFKKLEKEVGEWKDKFRTWTRAALRQATKGVKRVEFMSSDGETVPVSIPDWEKLGNRNNLKDEHLSAANGGGLNPEPYIKREETIVLSGRWVEWFKQHYIVPGKDIPEGVEFGGMVKLTVEGYTALEEIAKSETDPRAAAAQALLASGLKAPSVS